MVATAQKIYEKALKHRNRLQKKFWISSGTLK